MVDIADLFGIGFLIVSLLMTVALTWLGLVGSEFALGESEDEDSTSGA